MFSLCEISDNRDVFGVCSAAFCSTKQMWMRPRQEA